MHLSCIKGSHYATSHLGSARFNRPILFFSESECHVLQLILQSPLVLKRIDYPKQLNIAQSLSEFELQISCTQCA